MDDKPKISNVLKMSIEDLALVDRLIVQCGTYYYKISHPSKPGPHTNPSEIEDIRSEIVRTCLKVGERVWFPRGRTKLNKMLK
jgi:hypothetical protein